MGKGEDMRRTVLLPMSAAVVLAGAALAAPANAAPGEAVFFVDPGQSGVSGLAKRDGNAKATAFTSFRQVQDVVKRRGVKHVRLLIVGGVHHLTEPIVWDYSPKGASVVFDTAPGTGRVVFDGSRMNTARAARYPGETTCATYLLCIKAGYGSFTISGKTFQNAPNGIRLKGNTNITITGNVFRNLSGSKGYGGIHTESSSGLKIKNNLFSKLKNSGKMHGIYLVRTSGSTISGNRFEYVTGDPVRVRASSDNLVSGNKFYRSGSYATFSEWRDTTKGEGCGKGNVFSENIYGNSYGNKKKPMILWGGKGSPPVWGKCSTPSIKNGGGNKYRTTKPW